MKPCMLYVTVGTLGEARKIARSLVSERLVACVNIIENAVSIYSWNEEIQEDSECILIAKTVVGQRSATIERVQKLHSYDTPCVVSYDIADGSPDYLAWLGAQISSS